MRLTVLALFLAGVMAAGTAPAAPRVSGELGYGYDSNSNRARRGGDERASQQARAAAALTSSWRLPPSALLMLSAGLAGEHDFDFDGLSNAEAEAQARLLWRPDGGFYAPLFALSGAAAYAEFDSRLRDGPEYRAGFHVSGQLTTRISARAGFTAAWREARSAVFDLDARSALLDLDWHVLPRLALYLGYQYREGDLVSTGPAGPAVLAASLASEPDDAYGRAGDFVYRIAADAQVGTLGFNYALSPQWALDLQGQFVEAEADAGTRYERWLSAASLLFRF